MPSRSKPNLGIEKNNHESGTIGWDGWNRDSNLGTICGFDKAYKCWLIRHTNDHMNLVQHLPYQLRNESLQNHHSWTGSSLHTSVSRLNWLKYCQHVQVSKIEGKESPPSENRLIRYSISKLGTWILCWKWMWMILNDDLAPTICCRSIAYTVKLAPKNGWSCWI